MGRLILVLILLLNHCAKDDLSNPNDVGTASFWQKQELLCLVGQLSACATAVAAPGAPTVTAGNTQNTITWSSVSGASSYDLVYGTSPGVTKSSGTFISSVTSPYTHSGLTNNTTYYYTVVAKAGTAQSNLSQETSAKPICSPCKMFLTATLYAAQNLGGISGADSKCMSDSNRPSSPSVSIYKGLLWDGSTRVACTTTNCTTGGLSEHIDWVLSPNRTYVRAADSVTIATTNQYGIWTSQSGNIDTSSSVIVLTGMDTGGSWMRHAAASGTCGTWTGSTGGVGSSPNSSNILSGTGGTSCTTAYSIACAEQ